ncbi:tRNA lysidine(34) synthetase TilS [bacterium AH-315-J23]|nr:tRNA lysidine(34) synthetase TilS [bacterium AH-315-J23]
MDVERKVFAKLAELIGTRSEPLAVAFSGGGDSTALLSLVLKWNKFRPVYALIVDHGLRQGSAQEAELAQSRAKALGANGHILKCHWSEGAPKTAVQENARNARYQLLGDACRELGIETLLLGHNLADQAETVLMRKGSGSGWHGLAGIKERSRAPIWPALQGVTVLRPLLSCGRIDLRSYNKNNDLQWIDDPSNINRSFARIRAREYLAAHHDETQNLLATSKAAGETLEQEQRQISSFIQNCTKMYEWGGLALLPGFYADKSGQIAEALRYILPAISGEALPPSYDKRMKLARRLCASGFTGATLGGVRIISTKDMVLCVRDLGALLGRAEVSAVPPLYLKPAKPDIWDSRFAVFSLQDEVYMDALANWTQALDDSQKALLKSLPEAARGGMPVFIRNNKILHIPYVNFQTDKQGFKVRSLSRERLSALLGNFYR